MIEDQDIPDADIVKKIYDNFIESQKYAQKSRESFADARIYEIEDIGSDEKVTQMRSQLKSLEIYIRAIQDLAKTQEINLN